MILAPTRRASRLRAVAAPFRQTLKAVGAVNVTVVEGLLIDGWSKQGPCDVMLNGRSEVVPHALCRQLWNRGRLVGVFGDGTATQALIYPSEAGEAN